MSVLLEIKAIIFANLVLDNKKLKEATFNLFEAIDEDLDVGNFEQSSLVDEALAVFNKVLQEQDDELIQSVIENDDNDIDDYTDDEEEIAELIKNESLSIHDDDDDDND